MTQIKINGLSTYYEVVGNGYPFVFVHGGHLDSSSWRFQVDYFSKKYRTITYDIRGHGQSEIPEERYSMGDCVEDLCQLLDYLAIDQGYFAGHSMGGYIALSFTLVHPERVRALILVGANGGPVVGTLKMWGDKMASRLRLKSTTYARRFVRAHEANVARPDLSNKLSEIRKPTLIVVGERDTVTPPEISEVMLREISDSLMVVLPECDHGCHEDRPDSFNSTVRDFLDRIEAGQFP